MSLPTPYYDRDGITIFCGDNREILPHLEPDSIHSCVTDPPYGLSFMGKGWDHGVPGVEFWQNVLRVLKPGGHLLAFGGTRTFHRLAVAIEDAGFEIRDCIMWVYGSGFPKSLDVSKAIDKAAGAERGEESPHPTNSCKGGQWCECQTLDATGRYSPTKHPAITAPATDDAKQWSGWGTALKPSFEPIIVARKPLSGTVAANVLKHGCGGINVDGCRIPLNGGYKCGANGRPSQTKLGDHYDASTANTHSELGRWPANLIHDGSDEVLRLFPETEGGAWPANGAQFGYAGGDRKQIGSRKEMNDSGSAARFFYTAKADKTDRGPGNNHPTVKPLDLMRYLVRLVTPAGATVIDPFCGSGSTIRAAVDEHCKAIGCELSEDYCRIATDRLRQGVLDFTEAHP